MLDTRASGAILIACWLGLSAFSALIPIIFAGPPVAEPHADLMLDERFRYVGMMFAALPFYVKQWMAFQHFVFSASMLFALFHRHARIYLLAIFASHAISFLEIAFFPVSMLNLQLVALNHWLWFPALYVLARNWREMAEFSPFAIWHALALFQLSISLLFDTWDGVHYLTAAVAG